MNTLLLFSIALVFFFAVTNGMKDGANVLATAISSQSLSRFQAVVVVAAAEFLGPFFLGTKVASTVSHNIINTQVLTSDPYSILLITSGVLGAIVWNYSSLFLKLPTSSSFTLVGGLMGPVLYVFGWKAVPWGIFFVKVVLAMFLSPLLGLTVGYMVYSMTIFCLERASLKANEAIKKLQILTLIVLGVNHGTNDSQKSMGIIVLLLFIAGRNPDMTVPLWVKVICISAITLGVLMAGQTIIKTVGYGIFKIRPHHSLEAQLSAAGILLACNVLGAPVSTTQIVSSSVVGVGSAFRMKTVRWGIIKDIFNSWLITIPVSAATAIAIYVVLKRIIA